MEKYKVHAINWRHDAKTNIWYVYPEIEVNSEVWNPALCLNNESSDTMVRRDIENICINKPITDYTLFYGRGNGKTNYILQTMRAAVGTRFLPVKVIFNNPATIVFWDDGSKTIVKCQPGDTFDPEKGFAMCFAKKAMGNESNFNNIFNKCMEEAKNE